MIVCVLSLGSYWREPNDGRPVVWNSSGVLDQRGLRPRAKVFGHVRLNSRLYQEALGTSGLSGSCWQASPLWGALGDPKAGASTTGPAQFDCQIGTSFR